MSDYRRARQIEIPFSLESLDPNAPDEALTEDEGQKLDRLVDLFEEKKEEIFKREMKRILAELRAGDVVKIDGTYALFMGYTAKTDYLQFVFATSCPDTYPLFPSVPAFSMADRQLWAGSRRFPIDHWIDTDMIGIRLAPALLAQLADTVKKTSQHELTAELVDRGKTYIVRINNSYEEDPQDVINGLAVHRDGYCPDKFLAVLHKNGTLSM